MFRQIVTPTNTQLTLQLPDEFVGKTVEVIAFTTDDAPSQTIAEGKRTFEDAIIFFKKNAVDFSKLGKWTREDLYE